VSTVEAMIAPQLRKRELRFARHRDPAVTDVFCDPDKTEQVLLNLLSNAAKFTPAGGAIDVGSSKGEGMVRIRVHDTGVGIPRDKLDAIFEPFVQVDRTLTTNVEGAGLGLAISRDLARAMGGELSVESEVGAGSTFTLSLPQGSSPEPSRESDKSVSNGRQSKGAIGATGAVFDDLARSEITR
jgi:signal transduction histidine kinase